jgi:hypothetical protein
MRPLCALLCAAAFVLAFACYAESPEWTPPVKPPTFAFLLVMGINATEVADYSGKASVVPGSVVKIEGYHFNAPDKVTGVDSWTCKSILNKPKNLRPDEVARGQKQPEPKPQPIGVLVYVDAPPTATAQVTAGGATYDIKLSDLAYGRPLRLAQGAGAARAERVPISDRLTQGPVMNDYASCTMDGAGNRYLVYLGWEPDADQPYARCFVDGSWQAPMRLAPAPGDTYDTRVAAAGDGAVWAIWSARDGLNWDLWGRRIEGGKLGVLERLTFDPGAEFYHSVAVDRQGRIWLAWQSARDGQYDIYLRSYADGKWSPEMQVSQDRTNDWEPAVACDSSGRVYIAWDGYRNGNYDIFLRTYENGAFTEARQLTAGPEYEAHASLAVDKQDRLWIAWEEGGVLWGKDQGFLVPNRSFSRIRSPRTPRIACLENGALKEPVAPVADSFTQGQRRMNELPAIFFDGEGRLWITYRRSETKQGGGNPFTTWHNYLAYWDGEGWRSDIWLPYTAGRADVDVLATPIPDGGLMLCWAADERPWRNPIPGDYQNPGSNNCYVTEIAADAGVAGTPPLKDFSPTSQAVAGNLHPNETEDVSRRIAARWTVGGATYRLLAGETHRHTDVSYDGGGDGNMYDMMRYEIDAVRQDFIAAWDHDNGGGQDYSWWRSQKLSDLFYIEDVFEPLYGYERSESYPNGHRNVTFAQRGVRPLDRLRIPNPNANAPRKFILSPDDTKHLYDYLRVNDGICFSHTSATDMGTDWRDNDPFVEPAVEIYQGCRTNYEYEGAPKSATADRVDLQIGGYRPAGFVWNALAKGYRLGFMASSDHGSTHISYAGVWVSDFSRQAIFDAFKKRHCFGATDNIVVTFSAGAQMMGDEFKAAAPPLMQAKVNGTAPIKAIEIIKDAKIVYAWRPPEASKDAEFTWKDNESPRGTSYYYVRVIQDDDQVAWSSPMWINYAG